MNFSMAVRVEQHTVFCLISTTKTAPYNMVVMPPRKLSDFLVAERAETVLLFPEVQELPFPFEVVYHFHAVSAK